MSDSPPATESSWLRLRKRLFSRTTDLIAIAIVVFAGITMGGSVLEWWRTSPEEAVSPNINQAANELAPPDWMSGKPVRIDAGQLDVRMQRSELTGTADAAVAQMLVMMGNFAKEVDFPDTQATAEEMSLIESLQDLEPQWHDDSGVTVYHHDAPLAAYVAVKSDPAAFQKESLHSAGRVVSWGLVVPAGEARWTVWLFAPRPQTNGEPAFDWRDVLPDGASCDLALHSPEGHVMLSFSGSGGREQWQTEFDRSLAEREYGRTFEWSNAGNPSTVQYVFHRDSIQQTVTIYLHEHHESGRLQGLLQVSGPLEETP